MAFVTMAIQQQLLTQQKDQIEYQLTVMTNYYNDVCSEEADYLNGGGESDDSTYLQLEAMKEYYDTQQESLETQLEAINAEVDSYEKGVQSNIKDDCSLKFSV